MLDPKMQIFYLTDKCDNACVFCICKKHLKEKIGDSPSSIKKKVAKIQKDGFVDIYGGEPTLSKYFLDIVRQAKKKNAFMNIASNARSFSSKDFLDNFIKETQDYRDRIFIRSSLHGHTAAVHERHTKSKNSFKQATDGFKRLKKAGYKMSVNTVVTKHNYRHLEDIHRLIAQFGVDVFKISFMRFTMQNFNLAVSLDDLKKELPKVLKQVAKSKMFIDLDSIPYCVAPAQLALYAKGEDKFIENENRVAKPSKCEPCPMVDMCPGVDREYLEYYGGKELKPISQKHMEKFYKSMPRS